MFCNVNFASIFRFHLIEIKGHLQPSDMFTGSKYTKNAFMVGTQSQMQFEHIESPGNVSGGCKCHSLCSGS